MYVNKSKNICEIACVCEYIYIYIYIYIYVCRILYYILYVHCLAFIRSRSLVCLCMYWYTSTCWASTYVLAMHIIVCLPVGVLVRSLMLYY